MTNPIQPSPSRSKKDFKPYDPKKPHQRILTDKERKSIGIGGLPASMSTPSNNPITSCHKVPSVVVGGDEGTMHYECPVCHQSVNIDGSNPAPVVSNNLKEQLAKLLERQYLVPDDDGYPKYATQILNLILDTILAEAKKLTAVDELIDSRQLVAMLEGLK